MLTVDIVKKARELISDRAHWGKGYYAAAEKQDDDDMMRFERDWNSLEATCLCSLGAVRKAANLEGVDGYRAEDEFTRAIIGCVPQKYMAEFAEQPYVRVSEFNDDPETTHEQVLGAFDCLIAKMEGAK